MTHQCSICGNQISLETIHPASLPLGAEDEYRETWTVQHVGCVNMENEDETPEGDDPNEAWVTQIA